MEKINRETIIGGLGIAVTALFYFLTRNKTTTIIQGSSVSGTPTMASIQASTPQPNIVIPPSPPNYLTYNFGPSHDLSNIVADTSPLEMYSQGPQTSGNQNISPANSGGCKCGCVETTYVGSQSLPQSVVQTALANVMGVINNHQTNYSARIG